MEDDVTNKLEPQGGAAAEVVSVVGKLTRWKNYIIYALMALAIAEAVYILHQRNEVSVAKAELSDKVAQLDRAILSRDLANANEKACKIELADQNGKIADSGKRYERIQKEMLELAKRIAEMNVYLPSDDVRKQPTPKSCQEALDFMNRNFP